MYRYVQERLHSRMQFYYIFVLYFLATCHIILKSCKLEEQSGLFGINTYAIHTIPSFAKLLTRALVWVGAIFAPSSLFAISQTKTAAQIVAKLSAPSHNVLYIVFIFSRAYGRLATNDFRVTSCSAIFDAEKCLAGRAIMPIVLKIRGNV